MGLVSTAWLADHLADPAVRICDVRWYMPATGRKGADEFAAGHLPGAVFVDLDRDLAAPDDGTAGRHPLPGRAVFVAAMRRAGIGPGTHVVAYDDAGGGMAARLWWLLRAHGHESVSLLDGGITQWNREGKAVEREVRAVAPGAFESIWRADAAIDLNEMRKALREGAIVLDARSGDRYRGESEPVDARPGTFPVRPTRHS